jgi:hypothetical protein
MTPVHSASDSLLPSHAPLNPNPNPSSVVLRKKRASTTPLLDFKRKSDGESATPVVSKRSKVIESGSESDYDSLEEVPLTGATVEASTLEVEAEGLFGSASESEDERSVGGQAVTDPPAPTSIVPPASSATTPKVLRSKQPVVFDLKTLAARKEAMRQARENHLAEEKESYSKDMRRLLREWKLLTESPSADFLNTLESDEMEERKIDFLLAVEKVFEEYQVKA